MPRGDKYKYSKKQIRQAAHIEEGYKGRGWSEDEAEEVAWASVNKIHSGSKGGRSKHASKSAQKNNIKLL